MTARYHVHVKNVKVGHFQNHVALVADVLTDAPVPTELDGRSRLIEEKLSTVDDMT